MAFDALLLTARGSDSLDVGRLAEALLFYQRVHVIVQGPAPLASLLAKIGPNPLIDLLDESGMTLSYRDNVVGIHHQSDGIIELGSPTLLTGPKFELDQALSSALVSIGAPQEFGNLIERINVVGYQSGHVENGARWFQQTEWVEDCTNRILREYEASGRFRFRPARHDANRFTVDTNIDFEFVNRNRPNHLQPLEWRRLYGMTIEACDTLERAARADADIDLTPLDAIVVSAMLSPRVGVRRRQSGPLKDFQQMALGEGNAIAEAINSGARNFSDVVILLRRAERFRHWLAQRAPEAALTHSFYKETVRESWVDSLPSKVFRWLLGQAVDWAIDAVVPGSAELAKTALGTTSSAVDTFIIDSLARGWKPNQFVDGPLRAFSNVEDEQAWDNEREGAKRRDRNQRKRKRRARGGA